MNGKHNIIRDSEELSAYSNLIQKNILCPYFFP